MTRSSGIRLGTLVLAGLFLAAGTQAGGNKKERDIFELEAQKSAKGVKKIVFIGDTRPHGPKGNHEFVAGAVYLARTINAHYPDAYAVVTTMQKFPKDLSHADAVIVLMNHAKEAAESKAVQEAMARGAGFMAIHYGVEVDKGKQGESYLKWLGGYFEPFWSVNPWWTPDFKEIPKHEVTRGVKPFTINDEWYYHMRFRENMHHVTPILTAIPPASTLDRPDGPHSGNKFVREKIGQPQHVAWAVEREDGGRGFGFTGGHFHRNWGDDNFRKLFLNALLWVAKAPVPQDGVESQVTPEELKANLDPKGK